MRFALTEDQAALRDAVRAPLAAADWDALAGMGVFAAMTDLGLDETDLVPVLEEVGAAAVALPVTATAFVAAPLLLALGDDRAAAGSLRVAVAGPGGLTPFGAHAGLVLHLDGDAVRAGAATAPASTVDTSLDAVVSTPGEVLTDDPALVAAAAARAALGHAAELVGLGRRMLDLTVGYVRQRHQFGAPVGSFQAVKHQLADAYLGLEFARPAVLAAAWALREGAEAGAGVDGAVVLAAEAAHAASRTAIQCHGAIGYTVEYELHRYAKRAWALAALATPGDRLDALAATIGLQERS
ncbi:acyl-CoA dehydrogenase [Dactylosporangium aurantiacum]|uniref:Acyl-CoA dehydrogenase n=1 Tax=Dactylosporangium aurantiacum TaxID=35754 RepID=A0A9Q9IBT9_9ACTN|nr:acyl-CoA dehydrogenase family protein [Dactylosporangium aurantiacum]MDG6106390.1 acyl-CoA dehydrogenase family protein [Dactylosporangium aurantiacum]UWZ50569.1 acyl-CoA dehydrogenase [Dactylosporangium aurantiacum]